MSQFFQSCIAVSAQALNILTRERHRVTMQEIEQRKAVAEVGGGAAEAASLSMAQGSTVE
jgi:hypothetical protein